MNTSNTANTPSRLLYTMLRVGNLEQSIAFYRDALGMQELRRETFTRGRFTLVFMGYGSETRNAVIELTYNWDGDDALPDDSRHFGHLAYTVENIYETCQLLQDNGIVINRPPRDGHMAFVRSPDNVSIELLQEGDALAPVEPWASMENTGHW